MLGAEEGRKAQQGGCAGSCRAPVMLCAALFPVSWLLPLPAPSGWDCQVSAALEAMLVVWDGMLPRHVLLLSVCLHSFFHCFSFNQELCSWGLSFLAWRRFFSSSSSTLHRRPFNKTLCFPFPAHNCFTTLLEAIALAEEGYSPQALWAACLRLVHPHPARNVSFLHPTSFLAEMPLKLN